MAAGSEQSRPRQLPAPGEHVSFDVEGRMMIDHEHALAHLRAADPVLAGLIELVGPCALQRDPGHFYALLSSIVSQQISVRAAATIMGRVEALFPPGEG